MLCKRQEQGYLNNGSLPRLGPRNKRFTQEIGEVKDQKLGMTRLQGNEMTIQHVTAEQSRGGRDTDIVFVRESHEL